MGAFSMSTFLKPESIFCLLYSFSFVTSFRGKDGGLSGSQYVLILSLAGSHCQWQARQYEKIIGTVTACISVADTPISLRP
jgi:hypothetical protein